MWVRMLIYNITITVFFKESCEQQPPELPGVMEEDQYFEGICTLLMIPI